MMSSSSYGGLTPEGMGIGLGAVTMVTVISKQNIKVFTSNLKDCSSFHSYPGKK